MIALAALVVVAAVAVAGRRRRVPTVPSTVWAWLLAEVDAHSAGQADPRGAVVGVCLHGPPPLRRAARAALEAGGGSDRLLDVLRAQLASEQGDRICAAATAAAAAAGDPGPALARVRGSLVACGAAHDQVAAARRRADAACWLLLSPLLPVAAGGLDGWPALAVAAVAVAAWWAARAWVAVGSAGIRVFLSGGAGPPVVRGTRPHDVSARVGPRRARGGLSVAPSRPTDLAERLGPHLPRRFDPDAYAWWSARRRGSSGDRPAQLAQVLDRIALLLGLGHDLRAALEAVRATGRGPVVAELGPVASELASGASLATATRSWARRAACPHVAQLAADVRGCADVEGLAAVAQSHADLLRLRAADRQLAVLRRRTALVLVAGAAACAATAAGVLA